MKVAAWFGRVLYALIGLWYLLIGGIDLIEGKMRGLLPLLFAALILLMIIFSFSLLEKSLKSLIALTMLNIGFHAAFAYSILGEEFELPIDRISSATPSLIVIALSLLLSLLFWRKSEGKSESQSP